MSKLKKSLYFIIPLVLVLVIALAFVPKSFGLEDYSNSKPSFDGTSELGGQVAYAAESTGADVATKSEKGGAIFLEPNTSYIMNGGTITGKSKTYGGAVYVSNKATFTMNGGTITSCKAKYGGAIYVAAGGTCVIAGGTITKNQAEVAPAIYVEEGGILKIGENAVVEDNATAYWLIVSPTKEQMGGRDEGLQSTVELYTVTFGSYPQTYVGNDLNDTLEIWFSSNNPAAEKTYTIRENDYNTSGVWPAYRYTDGELYVRERSYKSGYYLYKNGKSIPEDGTYVWFKVEPIKWFIMNYDSWKSGSEEIELYSEILLTANIYFNASTSDGNSWEKSYIRNWCNEKFYNDAFTDEERYVISLTTVKNNVVNDYANADSDGKAADTQDYIYLKSCYEMISGMFAGAKSETGKGTVARICSPSDFALSNHSYLYTNSQYSTPYRGQGICQYWLRSAGNSSSGACLFSAIGTLNNGNDVTNTYCGVRPALRLSV